MLKKLGQQISQITIINLLVVLMTMILFFVFLPILIQFTNTQGVPAIANSTADQPTKDITTAVIQLFPIAVAVAIIITILNYSIPRRGAG